jgi:hypothetical protein
MRETPIPAQVYPAVPAKLGPGIFGIDLWPGVQHALTSFALRSTFRRHSGFPLKANLLLPVREEETAWLQNETERDSFR